jgi:hypothetical protein
MQISLASIKSEQLTAGENTRRKRQVAQNDDFAL